MEAELSHKLEQAVVAVKAGDRDCFRTVVEMMLPVLRAYVAARSLPGIDVDEIVQRVFIEAYKNLGEYREGTNFKAWLVTIARYQTMMEATRLRRQADYHSRFVPVAIARQMERQLADENVEDERLPHLETCLEQVKDSSRELLRHRYGKGLSMKQIAETAQRTTGAVRKELCLIRKQLHECIEHKIAINNASGR